MKVKRAGIGTKILVLILLVAGVTALLSMRSQLQTAQARRDQLSQQVQEQLQVNAARRHRPQRRSRVSGKHRADQAGTAAAGRDQIR